MEANETLNKLAGFIDELVAEKAKEQGTEVTLDKAIEVIEAAVKGLSTADETTFEKLADLTRTMAEQFDYVQADNVDEDWIKSHTSILDGDGDYVEVSDVDADWVEDHTNVLDEYIKKDFDDVSDWVYNNCDIMQFIHEVSR